MGRRGFVTSWVVLVAMLILSACGGEASDAEYPSEVVDNYYELRDTHTGVNPK